MPYKGRLENENRLLEAVGSILARDGFKNLGVNKVAKEAGVDKVLIYRYFGGLPQLITAFSQTVEFWPTLQELLGPNEQTVKEYNAEEQFAFFFKSFLRALRRRPMTQMIMVWLVSEPKSDLAKNLDDWRIRSAWEFFEQLEKIPVDPDLTAVVLLLFSAIFRLIEQSQTVGFVGGIDLTTDDGWQRIEQGIDLLVRGMFSENKTLR